MFPMSANTLNLSPRSAKPRPLFFMCVRWAWLPPKHFGISLNTSDIFWVFFVFFALFCFVFFYVFLFLLLLFLNSVDFHRTPTYNCQYSGMFSASTKILDSSQNQPMLKNDRNILHCSASVNIMFFPMHFLIPGLFSVSNKTFNHTHFAAQDKISQTASKLWLLYFFPLDIKNKKKFLWRRWWLLFLIFIIEFSLLWYNDTRKNVLRQFFNRESSFGILVETNKKYTILSVNNFK